jgi:energy-coupling factor transporter ATP-binding protein EcfA2
MNHSNPIEGTSNNMLTQYLLKKALDTSYSTAKNALKAILKQANGKLVITRDELEQSLNLHLIEVETWSTEVSFSDLKKAKYLSDIFIELDLFVYPRRIRIDTREFIQSIPLKTIFDNSKGHFILLGQPGAGKTTSMKYLCQLLLHDKEYYPDRFSFPVLIKLRELNNLNRMPESSLIFDQIFEILGLNIELPEQVTKKERDNKWKEIKRKLVIGALNELKVLLILDGFDELVKIEDRDEVVQAIKKLSAQLTASTLIVTSRSGDFIYNITNAVQYEISPLSEEQIRQFAQRWLINEETVSDFIKKVYESPFADTTIRPLTLAHLCAIYDRSGEIPEKPKTVYRKIINLLLEEWDVQRTVKRASRYAGFDADRKSEFLSRLAFELTNKFKTTDFHREHLVKIYKAICHDFDLEKTEATQVATELETHTGLFLQTGYEQFEFAHKSFQEFLTAEYIVRLPSIPEDGRTLLGLPNELAIAIAISSNPSDYFVELVFNRLISMRLSNEFVKPFLNRLLLEKPEMNGNSRVGLALVLFYSIYIELDIAAHIRTTRVDTLISELVRITKLILRRNSIDVIKNSYEVSTEYTLSGGEKILFMKRKEQGDGLLQKQMTSLPTPLYVHGSFLE